MSAKLRFHMMVKHSGCVYNAADAVRTVRLMEALDDITDKIDPAGPEQWRMVENDARRILNIWLSREQTAAAGVLARELLDSLRELAGAAAVVVAPAPALPHLEIVDKAPTAPAAPAPVPESDDEDEDEDEDEEDKEEGDENADDDQALSGDDEDDEDEDDDEAEAEAEAEADDEAEAEEEKVIVQKLPAPEPEPEVEGSVDGDDDADADADGEENNEIIEPSADEENAEEEEEGMEVEKRTIRGRDYWLDVNTNKLYAVVDDDDVGDEVGAIINGRPVFTA